MGHKLNSPSAFHRRRMCPGSGRLEAQLPDKDTEYSLRGTAAHAVLEACLSENEHVTDYRNSEVVVITSEGTTTTVKMDDEDIQAIDAAIDYVNLRREQMDFKGQPYFETEVTPSLWLGRENGDCDGTADIILIGPDKERGFCIDVIDYKHGAGVAVDAKDNDQLVLYALGACQLVDWNTASQETLVRMTIVQPRAHHADGPVRVWEIPVRTLFAMIDDFAAVAKATDDPAAPLSPGDHCRFCKANPCEAVTAAATAVFQPLNEPVPIDPLHPETSPSAPAQLVDWRQAEDQMGRPPELLSTDELARILDRAGLIKGWLKRVEEVALEVANNGAKIPGYKRVHANTKRKWGAEDLEIIKKLTGLRDTRTEEGKGKFKKADVTRVVPLSIAQVEKQVKPYVSDRQWRTFSQLIVKPTGAPVLAPETDSRPEIKNAEEVFQPLDQPQVEAAAKPPWET